MKPYLNYWQVLEGSNIFSFSAVGIPAVDVVAWEQDVAMFWHSLHHLSYSL